MPKKAKTVVDKAAQAPTILNPLVAPSIYSNYVHSNMTRYEISLRFAEIVKATPEETEIKEMVTIILSPAYAMQVFDLLGKTIKKYQEQLEREQKELEKKKASLGG